MQLFLDATSATAAGQFNTEMGSVHGWPLQGVCGGITYNYWSSDSGTAGTHWHYSLDVGQSAPNTADSSSQMVACVR
jgi:hypothetical protein